MEPPVGNAPAFPTGATTSAAMTGVLTSTDLVTADQARGFAILS
jgi:hypothetical protein